MVDALITDAVHITLGAKVWFERWGGTAAVVGQVRLVDPSAFTKIAALGIEEERVNVVISEQVIVYPSDVVRDGACWCGRWDETAWIPLTIP